MTMQGDTITTIDLDHDQLLIFDGAREGRLRVLHGAAWLTHEEAADDTFVSAGGELALGAGLRCSARSGRRACSGSTATGRGGCAWARDPRAGPGGRAGRSRAGRSAPSQTLAVADTCAPRIGAGAARAAAAGRGTRWWRRFAVVRAAGLAGVFPLLLVPLPPPRWTRCRVAAPGLVVAML